MQPAEVRYVEVFQVLKRLFDPDWGLLFASRRLDGFVDRLNCLLDGLVDVDTLRNLLWILPVLTWSVGLLVLPGPCAR